MTCNDDTDVSVNQILALIQSDPSCRTRFAKECDVEEVLVAIALDVKEYNPKSMLDDSQLQMLIAKNPAAGKALCHLPWMCDLPRKPPGTVLGQTPYIYGKWPRIPPWNGDEGRMLREMIASNPSAPADLLARIWVDGSAEDRARVEAHPNHVHIGTYQVGDPLI